MNAPALRTVLFAGSILFGALGLVACSGGSESTGDEESTSQPLVAAVGTGTATPADAGPPKSDCSSERDAVNAAIKALNAATDALNECGKHHPRSECGPQIAAYNAAVDAYNAAADAYNACIKKKNPTPITKDASVALPAEEAL